VDGFVRVLLLCSCMCVLKISCVLPFSFLGVLDGCLGVAMQLHMSCVGK